MNYGFRMASAVRSSAPPARPLITLAGATANATLSNGNRTLTRTSGADIANCVASAALNEDCYFEWGLSTLQSAAAGMYAGTDPLPTNTSLGQWWGQAGMNANSDAWYSDFYALYGNAPVDGRLANFDNGPVSAPVQIHGAYRHATRSLWLRIRAGGITYPWVDGGDPVAGTAPAVVFPGAAPVLLGATANGGAVTLLLPAEFTGTAPAGFTVGAYAP